MKKLFNLVLITVLSVAFFSSCRHRGDISISHNESNDLYKFVAHFPEDRTKEVQRYLDDKLENGGDFSFVNSKIDGTIALDNKMNFYIKMYPGNLKIEMNKSKNSYENYARMRKIGEDMGKILKND
ncbi:hypothetical protein [Emticicia sp. C21]|uniref:hypothetical protein n=1 Tax=Emticicia sp. C21 TaxID=2302915 RepID=UPI000E34A00A|nr:hypothetical protein [Emticicia sp. C21]RFS15643.1 hypothetical protein D0T08_16000 [Emticicia sp. C21]